jgi:hypothetical protein
VFVRRFVAVLMIVIVVVIVIVVEQAAMAVSTPRLEGAPSTQGDPTPK